jgi:hypothetical protein
MVSMSTEEVGHIPADLVVPTPFEWHEPGAQTVELWGEWLQSGCLI